MVWLAVMMALQDQPREVVVTASPLDPKDVFDTPYQAHVLTAEDRVGRQTRSLPEALREVPGVTVQKTGHSQGSPFIRGFTGYRNLLMMDGIRLNTGIQRQGPNQYWALVDPYMVDRLEVVRGPASVLYGSDALGGTVVAYSREPTTGVHGRALARMSTGEQSWVERGELWGSDGDVAAGVGVTLLGFGDIVAGPSVGEQGNTSYDGWNGDGKIVWTIDATSKLVAAVQTSTIFDGPRTHRTRLAEEWHGTTVGTDRRLDFDNRRELGYVQYRSDWIEASASLHRVFERESRVSSTGLHERRDMTADTLGLWARMRLDTFTFGAEFYRDFINSDGRNVSATNVTTRFERGAVADHTTYDLIGVYLQDEFATGDFDFTLGGRAGYSAVNADQVDFSRTDGLVLRSIDRDWYSLVGSARAVFHAGEHWNVIGGVSQGFRAPSVHDLTAISFGLSGTLEIPSPALKPERTVTFEVGTRGDYEGWGVEAFGFYTDMDNVIDRVLVANPFFPTFGATTANARVNAGGGTFYGTEFAAHGEAADGLTLFGDVAWTWGVTDRGPADKVNPLTGHVGARYDDEGWWVEGLATLVGRQTRLSPADLTDTQRIPPGGTPGFTTFTVRGGYRFCENAAVSAAIENMFNRDYRWHGSGSNEPGTNFIVTLDVGF